MVNQGDGFAWADFNEATIVQTGADHVATVTQLGTGLEMSANVVDIVQGDVGNTANVMQSGGAGNMASIFQGTL